MSNWWVLPVMGFVGAFGAWGLRQGFRTGESSFQMIGGRRDKGHVGFWVAVATYGLLLTTAVIVIGAWLFDSNFHL